MQLHRPAVLAEFERLDAHLLVVSFAEPDYLKKWIPHFQANFLEPFYREHDLDPEGVFSRTGFAADPERTVYHAYGLGLNTVREVYGFKILRQYARWKAEGKQVELPLQDPLQRGGDFVVNRAGKLTLSFTGHNQSERPAVEVILKALSA